MKETDQEAIEAMERLRQAMAESGLALISTGALREMGKDANSFTDEISCPYCTEWNSVTIRADEGEEKEVMCIGCSGVFNAQLVQYLVASEI